MSFDPIVCADCGQSFVMTASEKVRFQELIKNVPGFHMPRRCFECRRKRRMERISPRHVMPVVQAIIQTPAPAPDVAMTVIDPPAPSSEIQKEEVRLILATKDFEDLVHARPVVWQGVRVILADIGFKVMRDAIERAETERAKTLFRRNGSAASGEIAS